MISIYIYENLINSKVYIGQTNNIDKRNQRHITGDKSMPIDSAIKKYGRNNFSLNVITKVDTKDQADYAEIDWIARARELLGIDNVYNIGDGGEINNFAGRKHTEKSKIKMSEAHKGRVISKETRQKMSEAGKGRVFSEEHKENMSESLKGNKRALGKKHKNKRSEEHKIKLGEAHKGLKHTEESKNQISESLKGNKYNLGKRKLSPEQIMFVLQDNRMIKIIAKECGVSELTIRQTKKRNS
jgi:group I intron endonuclease